MTNKTKYIVSEEWWEFKGGDKYETHHFNNLKAAKTASSTIRKENDHHRTYIYQVDDNGEVKCEPSKALVARAGKQPARLDDNELI